MARLSIRLHRYTLSISQRFSTFIINSKIFLWITILSQQRYRNLLLSVLWINVIWKKVDNEREIGKKWPWERKFLIAAVHLNIWVGWYANKLNFKQIEFSEFWLTWAESLSEIVWLQSICVSTRTGKMFTFLLFPELNKKLFWSLIFVNQCILILFILVFPHFEISATFHIFNRMLDAWLLKYSKTS